MIFESDIEGSINDNKAEQHAVIPAGLWRESMGIAIATIVGDPRQKLSRMTDCGSRHMYYKHFYCLSILRFSTMKMVSYAKIIFEKDNGF